MIKLINYLIKKDIEVSPKPPGWNLDSFLIFSLSNVCLKGWMKIDGFGSLLGVLYFEAFSSKALVWAKSSLEIILLSDISTKKNLCDHSKLKDEDSLASPTVAQTQRQAIALPE